MPVKITRGEGEEERVGLRVVSLILRRLGPTPLACVALLRGKA